MKKLLIILTLGLMFGQTKVETRAYELDLNWSFLDRLKMFIASIKYDKTFLIWSKIITVFIC